MTPAIHTDERAGASQPGSVIAPVVRTGKLQSSRVRQRPRARQRIRPKSPRTPRHPGDFRYYVDARGHQHFNFEQRVWLDRSVQMAVTPVMTIALETLALNLLAHSAGECAGGTRVAAASRSPVKLARRFCAQCLLTAHPAGWVIPRATIEAWLASQPRPKGPAGNGFLKSRREYRLGSGQSGSNGAHTKTSRTTRRPKAAARGVSGPK